MIFKHNLNTYMESFTLNNTDQYFANKNINKCLFLSSPFLRCTVTISPHNPWLWYSYHPLIAQVTKCRFKNEVHKLNTPIESNSATSYLRHFARHRCRLVVMNYKNITASRNYHMKISVFTAFFLQYILQMGVGSVGLFSNCDRFTGNKTTNRNPNLLNPTQNTTENTSP